MSNPSQPRPLVSDRLIARHGFFTRDGGVSTGALASLQCGFGAETDDRAHVVENRARVARALGGDPARLVTAHQVHSARAVVVADPWRPEDAPEADALVTDRPDIVIGVLTADCAPCLLEDPAAGIVGAAHAGWKGAFDGVLGATVAAMETLGARRERIRLAIGPTIGPADYEVGPEFIERFVAADEAHRAYFSHPDDRGHANFDLPAFLIAQAQALGLEDAVWIGVSTLSDPARCYSYRRATQAGETEYGRLLSAIRAGAPGAGARETGSEHT